jgi:LAO/AO transport system kinase
MEAADMLVINKADGDLLASAKHTKADYSGAMQFIRRKHHDWRVPVELVSSRSGLGLDIVLKHIQDFHGMISASEDGSLMRKREIQASHWMFNQFKRIIINDALSKDTVKDESKRLLALIQKGRITAREAAHDLFKAYKNT